MTAGPLPGQDKRPAAPAVGGPGNLEVAADHFPARPRTQGPECDRRDTVLNEPHRPVCQGEVRPAGVTTAVGVDAVLEEHLLLATCQGVEVHRESVVDRHAGPEVGIPLTPEPDPAPVGDL